MIWHLRSIVILTAAALFILLASGIVLSLAWPANWNFMLGSLALGIIASFMGILGGILAAIFIVERYLEHERRENQKRQALQEAEYQLRWQAYIHGGLSMLSAIMTHLSLFVAYGRELYLQLLKASGDTSDVPSSVGDFIPWLINNLQMSRKIAKEAGETASSDSAEGRGMSEQEAIRISTEFRDRPSSSMTCSRGDLNILLHYLRMFAAHMHDQIFLFQPFLARHMKLGVVLVQLAHSLDDLSEHVERLLLSRTKAGKPLTSFELDTAFTSQYCSLGQQAIRVISQIWAHAKEILEGKPLI